MDSFEVDNLKEQLDSAYGIDTVNEELLEMFKDQYARIYSEIVLERFREARENGDILID